MRTIFVLAVVAVALASGWAGAAPAPGQAVQPARRAAAGKGAKPPPVRKENRPGRRRAPDARARVVAAATGYLAEGAFSGDCSTFVQAVFQRAGVPLEPAHVRGRTGSEAIFRGARPVKRPAPGDVAVFHDTYDRNGDGRVNDRFTHVAVVEAVDWPRVTLIHRGSTGIARVQMNLRRPDERGENTPLRSRRGKHHAGKILAGQLFAGFGSPGALGQPPVARRVTAAR